MTRMYVPRVPDRRFRRRGNPPHALLIEEIREFLTLVGIFHWKQWQGPMSQPPGVSDILGCYEGRFLAIEVKRKGEIPTDDQQAFLDTIDDAGGISIVAHSVMDVAKGLGLEHKIK